MSEADHAPETRETGPRPRPRRGLTLAQMMKLVVFSAAIFACLAPVRQFPMPNRYPYLLIFVFESVAIPLVLGCVGLVVLRGGAFRVWFVASSLFIAFMNTLVLFSISLYLVIFIIPTAPPIPPGPAVVMLVFSLSLVLVLVFLAQFVVPGRCPDCGRRRLFRDRQPPSGAGPRRAFCPRCRSGFFRVDGGWRRASEEVGKGVSDDSVPSGGSV